MHFQVNLQGTILDMTQREVQTVDQKEIVRWNSAR